MSKSSLNRLNRIIDSIEAVAESKLAAAVAVVVLIVTLWRTFK